MFDAKLNYLVCGAALVLLLLLGRFAYLQVVQHEHYLERSQDVRTRIELLPPSRAAILAADGTVLARSQTVWDVYLDYEAFASPLTLKLRACRAPERYDLDATARFLAEDIKSIDSARLAQPASRRRFFMLWEARKQPAARKDLEVCVDRLCAITGLTRDTLLAKLSLIEREVDAIAAALGDARHAKSPDVNQAWLRAQPALSDPEYWARVRRYPRSVAFEPVLAARLAWVRREAEFIETLLARGDGSRLRDMCFISARNCDARARALASDARAAESLDGAVREEYAAWRRLNQLCNEAVRRGGDVLADALEDLTRREGRIEALSERLERLRKDVIERHAADWRERWSAHDFDENPLLLLRDAPRDVIELIKVNADILPGLVCVHRDSRSYSEAEALAGVLGAVGLPDSARVTDLVSRPEFGAGLDEFIERWFDGDRELFCERFDGAVERNAVGISGIERAYDERLGGLYGARVSVRDARGRLRAIEYERAPEIAGDLRLTLDLELQRDILATVAQWEPRLAARVRAKAVTRGTESERWAQDRWSWRGAAVVIDIETGAVLALASFPGYDPTRFAGGSDADRAYRNALLDEAEAEQALPYWIRKTRFLPRATGATYHPGSTMKALTALALLDSGAITTRDTFDELDKVIMVGGTKLRTGHPAGANIDILRALEKSCNGFFYTMSQRLAPSPQDGWEVLRGYGWRLGIGEDSGLDLFGVRRSRLPEESDVWAPNLALMAIGQGEIEMTPLDVARLYACIGAGKLLPTHLCAEAQPQPQPLEVSPAALATVREGLRRVVFGPEGTARTYEVLKRIRCAGKTGTAENGKGKPDHGWFAGYAPYDKPKVAFAVLAEYSDLHGADISPAIGECIERYLVRTGVLKAPATVKAKRR